MSRPSIMRYVELNYCCGSKKAALVYNVYTVELTLSARPLHDQKKYIGIFPRQTKTIAYLGIVLSHWMNYIMETFHWHFRNSQDNNKQNQPTNFWFFIPPRPWSAAWAGSSEPAWSYLSRCSSSPETSWSWPAGRCSPASSIISSQSPSSTISPTPAVNTPPNIMMAFTHFIERVFLQTQNAVVAVAFQQLKATIQYSKKKIVILALWIK